MLHGLLAGAEVAVGGVRKGRVHELVEERRAGSRSLERLKAEPERALSTIRSTSIAVAIAAGAVGGAFLARDLAATIGLVPALVVAIGGIAVLFLILGELLPKAMALRSAERWALWTALPLRVAAWPIRPLVWLVRGATNAVLWFTGGSTSFEAPQIASEELQEHLEEAAEAGLIDAGAGRIATRAIDFGELLAADVMVPRNRVVAVPLNIGAEELRRVLLEEGHSRLPIYRETIDDVVGYLSIRDVLSMAWESELIVLADLIRPAYFVPETVHAVQLLREMQGRRISMAIAVEESGGFAGIVTIEDLVEELVGEIYSEDEAEIPEAIHRGHDLTALVMGIAPVRDVNRELDIDLPEGDGWSTIAGLCIEIAGRIPEKGAHLAAPGGVVLEVTEATPRRVREVRIHLPFASSDAHP